LRQIERLAPRLRDITDSFGTNSHYCLSVLHFVESIVLGVTDLALTQWNVRNSDATRLAQRWALD